jgi:NADPH2:quinone reductase
MSQTSARQMQAATFERAGAASEVLHVGEVDRPLPGPGEVLVRVVVSALNPTDVKIRSGATPRPIHGFQVPHMDGSGIVEGVGAGVPETRVGERVWLMLAAHESRWGTAAQWCVVPADRAVPLPPAATFELGAVLGVPAVTAAHCLFSDGPLTGRDVLVSGGAGAVGRSAVQLARWAGARVAATVSGPEKAEIATTAGAHLVVNYREADAADRLRAWTSQVDRVVELALGPNLDLDLAVAGQGTTIVTYAIDGPDPVVPVRRCMGSGVALRFMLLYSLTPAALAESVRIVRSAVAAGALDLPPLQRFSLDAIVGAHLAQEAGPVGRVLLDLPA